MSKIESSIARMHHLQAIPVHYDMGDRYRNDADGDGRIEFDCSSAVSYALENQPEQQHRDTSTSFASNWICQSI